MKPNNISKPPMDISLLLKNAPDTVEKDFDEPVFDWDNAIKSDSYANLKQQLTTQKTAKSIKTPTNIRLSKEVLDYFKGTGKGWQTRMNDVLLDYVVKQSH